jgi:hypothetical protein
MKNVKSEYYYHRISDTQLARVLLKNPSLLRGFSISTAVKKSKISFSIEYKGKVDRVEIDKAYVELTRKLIPHVGDMTLSFSLIRNAIYKALNWEGKQLNEVPDYETLEILRVASKYSTLITFSIIKKELYTLKLKTKKIERVLLDNGWKLILYENSHTKYFKK